MSEIWNLVLKEFGRIKSDRKGLIMLFLFPLITIIIFGFSSGGGYEIAYTVGIINQDTGIHGTNMVQAFFQSPTTMTVIKNYTTTTPTEFQQAYKEAYDLLRFDEIEMLFIIPENFSQAVDNGSNPIVIVYLDGSGLISFNDPYLALTEPFMQFKLIEGNWSGTVLIFPYMEYDVPSDWNQILNYMAGTLIPLIILATSMNVTSLSVVTEMPLPRLLLTRANRRDIILSKYIGYTLIMTVQVLVVFFTAIAFGLYILGSPLDVLITLLLTGLCGVSLGLFVSTFCTTEAQANQLFIGIFIFLTLFGGSFIPISDMPPAFGIIANALPFAHILPLFQNITLRGFGLEFVPHVLPLLIFCGVLLLLALIIFRFRKMEV
ncbi:MAG: ABC transporter permease [Candidatus Helarchaeota archaeon]